jgi:uncharacterized protein (DUF2267 family)
MGHAGQRHAVQEAAGDYERFIDTVSQAAELRPDAAVRAAQAVLQTLAERLSAGEARDIAAQLPAELASWLATSTPAESFDVDEFLRRIGERENVDPATAERHARAVLAALAQTITAEEFEDMVAELPKTFGQLLPRARGELVEVMPADLFVERVAERAGLDFEAARRAVDAVLETLAERLAGGEVADLLSQLPVQLHGPLRRGDALSNGAARRMKLDQFLRNVAEREGVTPAEARAHARAVFATLREAITPKEWSDVTVQLPDEYTAVLARP